MGHSREESNKSLVELKVARVKEFAHLISRGLVEVLVSG